MRKIASLFTVLMLFSALAFAQSRTVTGRVTDGSGAAVPFATITIKGTTTGVAADVNGNFSIEAAPNAVLIVSAAGYTSFETNIGNQTTLNLRLGAQSNLQEVVVTALGISRTKKSLPYSSQTVSASELNKIRPADISSALAGKVSGLQ